MLQIIKRIACSRLFSIYCAAKRIFRGESTAAEAVTEIAKDTIYELTQNSTELIAQLAPPAYQGMIRIGADLAIEGVYAQIEGKEVATAVIKRCFALTNNALAGPLGGYMMTLVTDRGVDMVKNAIVPAYANFTNAREQKDFQAKTTNYLSSQQSKSICNSLSISC